LDKAVCVISVDTELAWGSVHRSPQGRNLTLHEGEREIVRRLLVLFGQYHIKATWAIVGHLFLKSCRRDGTGSHRHVLQAQPSGLPEAQPEYDPFSDIETDPLYYAPDIVDAITSSHIRHEIASHTFTHAILGDPECTRDVAYSQLAESKRLAAERNLEMVSLVFPRNSVGHLDVLCELGFTGFRGIEQSWYRSLYSLGPARKVCHYFDRLVAFTPPCYKRLPCYRGEQHRPWLVNLPASMLYAPYGGVWDLVPLSRRVLQAKKGIRAAVRRKALFHLWFHPSNLATSSLLWEGLEEILSFISAEMQRGSLEALTMAETALHVNSGLEP
jgi:peptidoglycan/xylan/chitin deacetylase (PgdA/CDA1 family)